MPNYALLLAHDEHPSPTTDWPAHKVRCWTLPADWVGTCACFMHKIIR